MTPLNKQDLAAIKEAENQKKSTRKMNEIGISKMPNISLTQSEKTGLSPKVTTLKELKQNKTTCKLIDICSE